jgi:hypothetical protein
MASDNKEKIVPVINNKQGIVLTPETTMDLSRQGTYTFVKIDADGKEYGAEFTVGAYNAHKSYLTRPKQFKLKKSQPTK